MRTERISQNIEQRAVTRSYMLHPSGPAPRAMRVNEEGQGLPHLHTQPLQRRNRMGSGWLLFAGEWLLLQWA
jgi:hypothetical protein